MAEHVWVLENLAVYLSDGLEPAERAQLEEHVASCPDCGRALDEMSQLDRQLDDLFAATRPSPTLEDTVIQQLRQQPKRTKRVSNAVRAVLAMAAAALLAVVGAGAQSLLDEDTASQVARAPEAEYGGFLFGVSHHGANLIKARESKSRLSLQDESEPMRRTDGEGKGQPIDGVNRIGTFLDPSAPMPAQAEFESQTPATAKELEERREQKKEAPSEPARAPSADDKTMRDQPPVSSPAPPGGGQPPGPSNTTGMNGPQTAGASQASSDTARASGSRDAYLGFGVQQGSPPVNFYYGIVADPKGEKNGGGRGSGGGGFGFGRGDSKATEKLDLSYQSQSYQPIARSGTEVAQEKDSKDQDKRLGAEREKLGDKESSAGEKRLAEEKPPEAKAETAKAEAAKPEAPQPTKRVIIRSGDVEFEVDSFESAFAQVQHLVAGIKGAFVGTVSSEKLANGKMRGTVVVRVPPEHLDAFLLDLRKDLSKSGELKGQSISSQDVSKLYTDLESRLRAARAMEQRFLKIIGEAKGQIKDLLQAEKELGVWQTRIEEFEGELRYYANLAALSTLTIKLTEKEIRQAAAVQENERVQAGIEVDDVDKALRSALEAVAEAKGRVTLSKLTQPGPGQFRADLRFEVGWELSGRLRDRLRQLGNLVRLDVDRTQTPEGAKVPADGKVERGNTHFDVSFYNLASIAPRETVTLKVAADDVPAAYRSLRESVAQVKARTLAAQLNEQDGSNVSAQLVFDVSRSDEAVPQTALASGCEVLSRQVMRAQQSENVTDSRVQYRVDLLPSTAIPCREIYTLLVDVPDVEAAVALLDGPKLDGPKTALPAAANQRTSERPRQAMNYETSLAKAPEVLEKLRAAGSVRHQRIERVPGAPAGKLARVRFNIEFVNPELLTPRDSVQLTVAATDVPSAYRSLKQAVAKTRGRLLKADLDERDRQNSSAQLTFDTPRAQDASVQAGLSEAGEILTSLANRAPEPAGAWSDGNPPRTDLTETNIRYHVSLVPASNLPTRETVTLIIEVQGVEEALSVLEAEASKAQARVVSASIDQQQNGSVEANRGYVVPLAAAPLLVEKIRKLGQVHAHQTRENAKAPAGKFASAQVEVRLVNPGELVPRDEGVLSQVRRGLSVSLRGLSVSLSFLVVGLLFVLPWALIALAAFWLLRRLWASPSTAEAPSAPRPPVGGPSEARGV